MGLFSLLAFNESAVEDVRRVKAKSVYDPAGKMTYHGSEWLFHCIVMLRKKVVFFFSLSPPVRSLMPR